MKIKMDAFLSMFFFFIFSFLFFQMDCLLFIKQGVDMFGKRVGFLKFKADVIDKETGKKVNI